MKKILLTLLLMGFLGGTCLAQDRCEEDYVPAHSEEELIAVMQWAVGGAFAFYAERAGFEFDKEAYLADAPNMEILSFGIVNGASCWDYHIDVTSPYISMLWALDNLWVKENNPNEELEQSFSSYYLQQAQSHGFFKYLTPIE